MAAILCLAFCVCDIMNMVGMFGRSVYYVMNEPFSAFRLWKASQYGCALRSLNCAKKVLLLFKYWQNSHTKSADGNVCTFSTSSSQLASSLGVPLNRRLRGSHPDPYHLAFHTVAVPGLIPALFFFVFFYFAQCCSILAEKLDWILSPTCSGEKDAGPTCT